jgi:hypothetical protein
MRAKTPAELRDELAAHLDANRLALAPVKGKPYLPPPVQRLSVEAELERMKGGQTDRWFLTCRRELLAQGLIETVLQEDGRWLGTRITAKGLARLKGR